MSAFAHARTWESTRQLSPNIWKGVDLSRLTSDLNYGYGFLEDYTNATEISNWTATQATSGTFGIVTGKYGLAAANAGATTANQGINCQRSLSFATSSTIGTIIIEGRLALSGWSTAGQLFFGFHETDTTILGASGALTGDDLIGFHATTTTAFTPKSQINTGSVQTGTASTLLTDGTYVRYGIKITRNAKAEFYVNGTLLSTITSTMPSVDLSPSIVVRSNGTTQPIATFDWVAAAYLEDVIR
jgi:hypothetical protein